MSTPERRPRQTLRVCACACQRRSRCAPVQLVDDQHGRDLLLPRLAQHGVRLRAHAARRRRRKRRASEGSASSGRVRASLAPARAEAPRTLLPCGRLRACAWRGAAPSACRLAGKQFPCFGSAAHGTTHPSHASTSTSAPSLSLAALDTSLQKSTWPGESIRLIKYAPLSAAPAAPPAAATCGTAAPSSAAAAAAAPPSAPPPRSRGVYSSEMEADFIVMPRSWRAHTTAHNATHTHTRRQRTLTQA
jgi:hypothetical protein